MLFFSGGAGCTPPNFRNNILTHSKQKSHSFCPDFHVIFMFFPQKSIYPTLYCAMVLFFLHKTAFWTPKMVKKIFFTGL